MYVYVNTMRIKCSQDTYLNKKYKNLLQNSSTCDGERRYLRKQTQILTEGKIDTYGEKV